MDTLIEAVVGITALIAYAAAIVEFCLDEPAKAVAAALVAAAGALLVQE